MTTDQFLERFAGIVDRMIDASSLAQTGMRPIDDDRAYLMRCLAVDLEELGESPIPQPDKLQSMVRRNVTALLELKRAYPEWRAR